MELPSLALLALLAGGAPQEARAQAGQPEPLELDRIVVTARRRPEPAQAVPGAVTAVSGDELESRGAQDIGALGAITPNLLIYPARAFNGTVTTYIRGIGQFDPIWGVEPGVGIYIDDVYLARPQGALLDLLDVDRVEVLRGPQGTLYGRNTLAGAIKVIPREPSADFEGKVALTVGDYTRRDGKLVLNLPINDQLRTRVALAKYERAGFGRNLYTGDRVGDRDVGVARIAATWTPLPDVEVRLAWDRLRDRSDTPPARRLAVPPRAIDPDQIPLDPGSHDVRSDAAEAQAVDNEGASLGIDWAFRPQWRLRSISAWRHGDSQAVLDMDSLPRPIWVLGRDFRERQWSQEFQLHFDGDATHVAAGLYLFDGVEAGDGRSTRPMSPPPSNLYRAEGAIRTRSTALYANVTRSFGTRWELDAGLRHTVERKSVTAYNAYYRDLGYTMVATELADFADRSRFSAPTPRLALSWHANDRMLLYAQASRGFKGGSYNVRANAAAYPDSVHPIAAETVMAYELGAKTEWFGGRLQANAALFRNDYRDIQLSVTTATDDPRFPAGFPDFRNAGSGTSQGAELEWRARLAPRIDWTGYIGLLDTHYDRYIENGVDVAGSRRFPNAPRRTAGTSLVGDFPLRRAGWLRARIDGRYQGETWPSTDLTPLLRQGGYALWNASLAWTSPQQRWELALRGDNLGNRAYRNAGFAYPFGIVTGYYGPPRTYALTLGYSF
ncbi:MAG: TonB-dependent receptor [Lysobacteraceae bacterium]|nr:MAG: TonB-dependent receptor [Xanthomonadaceae bacterium]